MNKIYGQWTQTQKIARKSNKTTTEGGITCLQGSHHKSNQKQQQHGELRAKETPILKGVR